MKEMRGMLQDMVGVGSSVINPQVIGKNSGSDVGMRIRK